MAIPRLEIHYADDWAALYVDGVLDPQSVGDSYIAEERAFAKLGVKQVHDDAFLRGQTQRDGVAKTLMEVAEYRTTRSERLRQAEEKRQLAARLVQEAEALEKASG